MFARLVLASIAAVTGEPFAFDHFHSSCEIEARFADLAATFPNWFRAGSLGLSVEGRPIHCLRIEPPGSNDDSQAIWFDAAIHGGELASCEPLLAFVELVAIHAASNHVPDWLADRRIVIVPVINVDGRELSLAPPYPRRRTNLRSLDPELGVDLNRNFPHGDAPPIDLADPRLAELAPETAAVVREWLVHGGFDLALSFHTSANLFVPPTRRRAEDADRLALVESTYLARTGFTTTTLGDTESVRGTTMEWFHLACGATAATIEMGPTTLAATRFAQIPAEHRLLGREPRAPTAAVNDYEQRLLAHLDDLVSLQLDFLCTLLEAWPRER